MADRQLQVGESVKSKRLSLGWSQETLGYKAGVSGSVVAKIELGRNVKNGNLGKVLLALNLKDTLSTFRDAKEVTGFKALSLEELRTCVACCRDFMREGNKDVQRETMSYKKAAEEEILLRLREFFKGEDVEPTIVTIFGKTVDLKGS